MSLSAVNDLNVALSRMRRRAKTMTVQQKQEILAAHFSGADPDLLKLLHSLFFPRRHSR